VSLVLDAFGPLEAPLTAAASATPSFEPTVLTEGEPAIVGSCCLLSARNDMSDDCLLTVGVRCDGDGGTRDDETVGVGLDLDGGVDGTAILWAPEVTEALKLATR
jgi:hypothetical protein